MIRSRCMPTVLVLLALVLALPACQPGPLPPSSALIYLEPAEGESAEDFEARVRQAFSLAQSGTAFEFGPGTFAFERGLLVSASHVTIAGQGMSETILDFSNASAAEAILASGDEFVIRDIGIFDPPGDAVKAIGVDGVVMQRVSVNWPNDADPTNGPYGLYPVLSTNILIEGCYVRGAEDAGIYVGQSSNVVVRGNWVEKNVAGIEIENTVNAVVALNIARANTGGILVFDLTGLSQPGRSVAVRNNLVFANNGPNFGSGVVGLVPPGSGILVLATDDVEIYRNRVHDNVTGGIAVLSYDMTLLPYDPATYDPYPERIHVHDNELWNNGQDPQGTIGQLLAALVSGDANGTTADIIWDGIVDADVVEPDGQLPPDRKLCVRDNGTAVFATLAPDAGDGRFDLAPHDCAHPPVPDVVLADRTEMPPEQQSLSPEETALLCGAIREGVNWPATEADCPQLSDYNLFAGNDPRGPALERGVEYQLTTPLHSDYATKYRFAFVPPGDFAEYDAESVLDFPIGTIITKTFAFDTPAGEQLVETRLLVRRETGWRALVYLWNEEATDAALTQEGAFVDVEFNHPDGSTRTLDYQVPDANQCAGCHAGLDEPMDVIGPKARWLNRPVPGGGPNQLEAWTAAGILAGAPHPDLAPRLPDAFDPAQGSVAERARSYLEINCAHCHRPEGRAGFTGLWLEADEPEGFATGICKTPIAAGVGGLVYNVVPGAPDESILVFRMESVVPSIQMPELAKSIAHDVGVDLVREYVAGLEGDCPNIP